MTDLTAALAQIRPVLADRYANQIRSLFNSMVEVHGANLKGIYNCHNFARSFSQLVAPVIDRAGERFYGDCVINEEKLARRAAQYAEAAVAQWKDKIDAKLGDLENVTVKHFAGCNYLITGWRNGKSVAIDQDVIVKSSTKGLLFNQFPARIYVDRKFISEAKYKAMFA